VKANFVDFFRNPFYVAVVSGVFVRPVTADGRFVPFCEPNETIKLFVELAHFFRAVKAELCVG
jgi:hypothetical protein